MGLLIYLITHHKINYLEFGRAFFANLSAFSSKRRLRSWNSVVVCKLCLKCFATSKAAFSNVGFIIIYILIKHC